MYVSQSNACTVPNGSTPVSKAKITAAQQILSRLNTNANNAQEAFTALLCRLDLNTNGWPLAEYGGVPSSCGDEGALPIGGNSSGLQTWPPQLIFLPTPTGIAPVSVQAYSAPPAPQIPSLVTQGHSRYVPPAKRQRTKRPRSAPAPVPAQAAVTPASPAPSSAPLWQPGGNVAPAFCEGIAQGKPGYTACLAAQGAIATTDAANISPADAAATSAAFSQIIQQQQQKGMGCADSGMSCDFLTGMISAIGLGAALLYLFDYLKRSGRIGF
jgi:hypothetical protein